MWICRGLHRVPGMGWLLHSRRASTIYALSSGQGKCGVAVVRVSGSGAPLAILNMTRCQRLPPPRTAVLHTLFDPVTKEDLDRGLVLWFPGPRSFTGEDCCELQVHGGPAVVAAVLAALSKLPAFRPADPGEFTKRAFHAGKLDLTQVEGLGDLIHAETELQRKQALLQMEGALSTLYHRWRATLLRNVAHVEAYIDFSEDENIEDGVMAAAKGSLEHLRQDLEGHLADGRRGERLRDGIRTVILGEPNVGKSSLLNALCQRPAAIVTPIEGTTRDIVETHININGYPLVLADTAGLRNSTSDIVEKEGISRAYSHAFQADLIILVTDARKCLEEKLEEYIKQYTESLQLTTLLQSTSNLIIINKMDLLSKNERKAIENNMKALANVNLISCTSGEGFPLFLNAIAQQLQHLCGNPSRENPSLSQARHRFHLEECSRNINRFFTLTQEEDIPLAAHQLRSALRHLGKITGQVSSEEILDVIFKDFCIGK